MGNAKGRDDGRQAKGKRGRVARRAPPPLKPEPRQTYPEDFRFIPRPTMVVFGRGSLAPSIHTWSMGTGALSAAIAAGGAAMAAYFLLIHGPSPAGMEGAGLHIKGALASASHVFPEHWAEAVGAWRETASPAARAAEAGWGVVSGALGAVAGRWGWKASTRPTDGNLHVNGRRLLDNEDAMREWIRVSANERKGRPKSPLTKLGGLFTFWRTPEIDHEIDIDMVPGVPMAADRMKKHGLFLGPPGSGKTVVQAPMIDRAIRGGHRIMAFDIKGDFTELFYKEVYNKDEPETDEGRERSDNQVILLAPFDKRSHIWDIAADVRNKQDAKAFAEANIEASDKDPMWSNLARAVVVGCVHMLQVEKPGAWGFGDLANLLAMTNMKIFIAIMKKFNDEGLRAVDTADVTAAGVMSNVMAGMAPIFDLADAWPTRDEKRMFSIREWAGTKGDNLKKMRKAVIIKGNPDYESLTRTTAGSIFQIAQAVVTSIEDDPTRCLYFLLDEFPTLGKVNITKLITLGRSKGARVWLGMQTLNQFKAVHGEDTANTLKNSVSTFVSLGATGPEAEEISSLIGERNVERMVTSGSGANVSTSPQNATIRTITPAQLALVGERKPFGVKALVWGKGIDNALLLGFPYPNKLANPLKKEARGNVIADWTKAENSKVLGRARQTRKAVGSAFMLECIRRWGEEDPGDKSFADVMGELEGAPSQDEVLAKRKGEFRKKNGMAPADSAMAPEPNHTNPDKPFIPSDPADREKVAAERKIWGKAKYEQMKATGAADAPSPPKAADDDAEEMIAMRDRLLKSRESREAAPDDRSKFGQNEAGPVDEGRIGNDPDEGEGGGRAEADSPGLGADFSGRLAAATTVGELERLARVADGDSDAARRVAEKLTLAKMAKLNGRSHATLTPESASRRKGHAMTQDAPVWIPNPALAAMQAGAGAGGGERGEDEDPFAEAIGEHAQTMAISSILGLDLAEIIVHAVSAAEKVSGQAAMPAMVPVWSPPRRTGG